MGSHASLATDNWHFQSMLNSSLLQYIWTWNILAALLNVIILLETLEGAYLSYPFSFLLFLSGSENQQPARYFPKKIVAQSLPCRAINPFKILCSVMNKRIRNPTPPSWKCNGIFNISLFWVSMCVSVFNLHLFNKEVYFSIVNRRIGERSVLDFPVLIQFLLQGGASHQLCC